MSIAGKVLVRQQGTGTVVTKLKFEGPIRLLIEVQSQSPFVKRPEIRLHQFSTKPADEIVSNRAYQRRNNGLIYTTQKTYSRLAKVLVKGLGEGDTVVISTLDFSSEDHTLFMPLWAGLPDDQHPQTMSGRALLDANRFHRPYGIPACPVSPSGHPEAESISLAVHLPWNMFICEGFLRYGFRSDAARIVAHLMTAVIQNLKQNQAFFARYHAENGNGLGERNTLTGLAPVRLFLQVLGVQILSPTRVRLEGENPFPWVVTVGYRGLKDVGDWIRRQSPLQMAGQSQSPISRHVLSRSDVSFCKDANARGQWDVILSRKVSGIKNLRELHAGLTIPPVFGRVVSDLSLIHHLAESLNGR